MIIKHFKVTLTVRQLVGLFGFVALLPTIFFLLGFNSGVNFSSQAIVQTAPVNDVSNDVQTVATESHVTDDSVGERIPVARKKNPVELSERQQFDINQADISELYTVQLGAFVDSKNAQIRQQNLLAKNYQVKTIRVINSKQRVTTYKIILGLYPSLDSARKAAYSFAGIEHQDAFAVPVSWQIKSVVDLRDG